MKLSRLTATLIALLAITMITTEASAMYHAGMGRFLQRDPHGTMSAPTAPRVGMAGPAAGGAFVARDPMSAQPQPGLQYADGMNLYQYVRSNPAHRLDAMGLASKPAKQCQVDGGDLAISFDGKFMEIASSTFHAVSGKPTREEYRGTTIYDDALNPVVMNRYEIFFDYSVARQKIPNVGPIPEGSYWLDICEWSSAWGASFRHQSFTRHWFGTLGWGTFRAYPKRADRAPRLLVIIELRGDGSPRQQKELKDERANPSQSFPGFR